MQRINQVTQPQGKAKTLLDAVRQSMGSTPNIFTTFANAPAALEAYLNFNSALGEGKLNPKIREQIAITVAGFNGCDYCASAHTYIGGKSGIDGSELEANIAGRSSNSKTQAALVFAKSLLNTRGRVSNEDLQAVRDAGYDDEEIIEILAHVALNTFTNYFNETALTDIDFPVVTTNRETYPKGVNSSTLA